jgi:OOP family OmpA-OmpF porin
MRRKILCIFPLISFLYATTPESEIGINIGMASTKNKHGSNFENPTFGLSYQDSRYVVSPRIDIEYVDLKREEARALMKVSLNGVYEYENRTASSPYILGGIGYEKVDGEKKDIIESHTFIQAGVGVRMDIEEGYTEKIEGRFLQILGGNNAENEAIVTGGLTIPLSFSTALPKPIIRKLPQRRVEIIKPILIHEPPKIFNSNNNECSIKISLPDFDRDGVEDRLDQCPDTPCNFSVDGYGCPVKATLKIHFATNSSDIRGYSMVKVAEFANFLLKNRGSMITIIGHTDSFGSSALNRKLSYSRANAVVLALVDKGVSPSRIHAVGRGESEPIASNKSEEGRAKNRRIEAILTYLKRK